MRLTVVDSAWEGVGQGHGRLLVRRVEVESGGRGAATRPRRATLWLPGPDGGVTACVANAMTACVANAMTALG